jgi:hypothetical protein
MVEHKSFGGAERPSALERTSWGAIIGAKETRERRTAHRYGLNLPIVVRRAPTPRESVLYGKTHNISTGGIYFTIDRRLAVDEVLDFSLTLPRLAQGTDVLVTGRARVLRLVQKPIVSEPIGVAAVIENFQIVQPEGGGR